MKYKSKETSKEELLKMLRRLFKKNMELTKQLRGLKEFSELLERVRKP